MNAQHTPHDDSQAKNSHSKVPGEFSRRPPHPAAHPTAHSTSRARNAAKRSRKASRRHGALTLWAATTPARERVLGWAEQGRGTVGAVWSSPRGRLWQHRIARWQNDPMVALAVLVVGISLSTLLIAGINATTVTLPNPGVVYLPLVAMLAYHWGWRLGVAAGALVLACVYFFFISPDVGIKTLHPTGWAQLLTLALVILFTLALVRLATTRRTAAEQGAARFAALNAVGQALAGELDESRLLARIAETARTLTGASFAAFTLRPVDRSGQPLVPAEGSAFHLAAVTGVTPEQERLFRRLPLGGEGILAPIFRYGVPVRVADVLAMEEFAHGSAFRAAPHPSTAHSTAHSAASQRASARQVAEAYAAGRTEAEDLQAVGVPRGHPVVRSFLGVPLLDREGRVAGGLLLGHDEPGCFTEHDEELLLGLAAQAAIALENARLYQEATLQGRELDAIFESISDGILVVDSKGKPLRENYAARQLLDRLSASGGGRRTGEAGATIAAGKETDDASETADVGTGEQTTASSLASILGVQGPTSFTVPGEDGECREYLLTRAPVMLAPVGSLRRGLTTQTRGQSSTATSAREQDESEAGATVVVAHDITETRRLLEERRARAEAESRRALLQTILGELPSAVFLVRGVDARLGLINPAGRAVWGADWIENEPMGTFLERNDIQVLKSNGEAMALGALATLATVRSGQAVRHFQEIIHRPDGTSLPVLVNAVPIASELLVESGVAGQAEGGTERYARHREPVALIVLQDVSALKEAERLKDEFVAIAAHELKTPIAAVKGYTGMLTHREEAEGGVTLAAWQRDALDTIDQATTRLTELVDDLLDVSRIQAGGLQLRPEPHDLVALTRRVLRRAQGSAAHHALVLDCAQPYVVALIDVRRADQVVSNLVNNAVKYSPSGGEVRVTIAVDEHAGEAKLAVRDTGIGIPENQRAQLFGRFSRAENARELGIPGTGLGLFLTRELVEHQGGRIWFESEEGKGSTFYVTFPLVPDSEE